MAVGRCAFHLSGRTFTMAVGGCAFHLSCPLEGGRGAQTPSRREDITTQVSMAVGGCAFHLFVSLGHEIGNTLPVS